MRPPIDAAVITLVRYRVSLSGHVRDSVGAPVDGGVVRLFTPDDAAAFDAAIQAWASAAMAVGDGRPDVYLEAPACIESRIRPDGRYIYLDLAPGHYVLRGGDMSGRPIAERKVEIIFDDRRQYPPLLAFDLVLKSSASELNTESAATTSDVSTPAASKATRRGSGGSGGAGR